MDNFQPQRREGLSRWMWWLYLVVAFIIVFIFIWMFMALSNHDANMEQQENAVYQTEVPATQAPALPPSQL